MTRRRRTTMTVFLTVVALVVLAGVAWAQGFFPDVSEDNAHADAIEWAAENGIVQGYENGNFGPFDNILRGQAASMFMRYDTHLRSTLDGDGGNGGIGLQGDCSDCHDDSQLIPGYQAAWEMSLHATNTSFVRGTSASCAGCHSGDAFQDMIAAGLSPNEVESGDDNPVPQNCRTCHEIHETFTFDDFALVTTAAVDLQAFEGVTYDSGDGNLCANCHQPRRAFPAAVDGMVEITSTHWGPHHGPQSAILLGLSGSFDGTAFFPHANGFTDDYDSCVTCHVADPMSHDFEPKEVACTPCHGEVDGFDLDGLQSQVQGYLDALEVELIAEGLLDEEGHPAVQSVPEDQAAALWNWINIAHEDESLGVHNPPYTIDLLESSLEDMGIDPATVDPVTPE